MVQNSNLIPPEKYTDDISVLATDAIVAPGTNGSMEITVEGKAEVDADVTFTTGSTEWKDVKLTDNTTPYYPILWTLTLEGESNPVTNGTLAEVESYFKTATFHYEAENYDAADASHVNLKYTLSWNWAFVYADTDEARHINDKYDTLLGAASANGLTESSETIDGNVHNYSYVTSISFNLGVSVTQAD